MRVNVLFTKSSSAKGRGELEKGGQGVQGQTRGKGGSEMGRGTRRKRDDREGGQGGKGCLKYHYEERVCNQGVRNIVIYNMFGNQDA